MKTILRLIIYLRFVPVIKLWRSLDKNAEHVVIIFPHGFKGFIDYFRGSFQNDLCNVRAILDKNLKLRLSFGPSFGSLHNKFVYLSAGMENNLYGFDNHAAPLHFWIKQLEEQGNKCFLNYHESLFWENKIHMHQEFERLNIPSPTTYLMTVSELREKGAQLKFPFIIKWPHSAGSAGLYSMKNEQDLGSFFELFKDNDASMIIVQKRLNMKKDLRVICAGHEVVWHYWRINLSNEWKPTSTGHGSKVDFENFPEQWRPWILEQFNKLNLRCGAFDIAWENDDLNTEPLILEVSPSYSPNPMPANSSWLPRYGMYKKKLLWKDSYIERHMLLQYEIRKKTLS